MDHKSGDRRAGLCTSVPATTTTTTTVSASPFADFSLNPTVYMLLLCSFVHSSSALVHSGLVFSFPPSVETA
ncbi:hypothetical protein BaRGS_00034666, partial [Batillaria attramentaria]